MEDEKKVNEVEAFLLAGQYLKEGYIGISNKFKHIGKVDRKDWLTVIAKDMGCPLAFYYNLDGSGLDPQWEEHYIRCYSKDILTVSEEVYKIVKKGQKY